MDAPGPRWLPRRERHRTACVPAPRQTTGDSRGQTSRRCARSSAQYRQHDISIYPRVFPKPVIVDGDTAIPDLVLRCHCHFRPCAWSRIPAESECLNASAASIPLSAQAGVVPFSSALRIARGCTRAFKGCNHVFGPIAEPGIDDGREPAERVHDSEHADPLTGGQLVMDEVHGPDLVGCGSCATIVAQLRPHSSLRRLGAASTSFDSPSPSAPGPSG